MQLRQPSAGDLMIWQDSPSLVVMLGPACRGMFWAAVVLAAAAALHTPGVWLAAGIVVSGILIRLAIRVAQLRSIRYCLTNQCLTVEAGLFSRACVAYAVDELGDAVIGSTPVMRMVGVSDLTIRRPFIRLSGIRNAEAVRELIRQAGGSEAQQTGKIPR